MANVSDLFKMSKSTNNQANCYVVKSLYYQVYNTERGERRRREKMGGRSIDNTNTHILRDRQRDTDGEREG